jgi:hypothetical protein
MCDAPGCRSLCNNIEAYVGPLDGLTIRPEDAEYFALKYGFKRLSAKKWYCPECAEKAGLSN